MSNHRLRLLFCDHLNLARGKYLPTSHIEEAESRFCQGIYALTYDKELLPAPCSTLLEGLPDMIARYDVNEVREGWHGNDRIVIADQYDRFGEVLPVCGRSLLKRTVKQWNDLGYNPQVGIELEAYAFVKNENGEWQPLHTPGCFVYGTGPFADPNGITDAIWQAAELCGFKLEMITAEFDAPQFEFTLRYDNAVAAVDDSFLFRLLAREIALEHGILLTFMPKPIADLSGSGLHVNFSLTDNSGKNIISDSDHTTGLSDVARGCIAGLMFHHKGLAALLAPTVNSYQRLEPASLSGFWRNWGYDHRGVTTRIASETGAHARIEHRMADGAANPYTLVASVLQAARLGLVNEYELGPAETGDCLENQDAKDSVGADLASALADLQADQTLVDAVGPELVGNLMVIKQNEIEKTSQLKGDTLRDFYIHYL